MIVSGKVVVFGVDGRLGVFGKGKAAVEAAEVLQRSGEAALEKKECGLTLLERSALKEGSCAGAEPLSGVIACLSDAGSPFTF
jgi:hypothetical protein